MEQDKPQQLRMYSLVLYQLKPIQQGIQSQHAITDYAENYFNDPVYRQWASIDKTTIILSVGGSNQLIDAIVQLLSNNIPHKIFREPDLYDVPTAVCFLVDERVWDKLKYPDPAVNSGEEWDLYVKNIGGNQNLFLRSFLSNYRLA